MIELELKYQIKNIPQNIKTMPLLNEKYQTDIYYDTKDYCLLSKGNFLRIRNNSKLEFKLDISENSHLYCKETSFMLTELPQRLDEINMIFTSLKIDKSPTFNNIEEFIKLNNLHILAPINKRRTDYKFEKNCTISIDNVDNLGLFLEAEIMIENDSLELKIAEQIRNELFKKLVLNQIIDTHAKQINVGYVELYLQKYNSIAYNLGKFKL